MAAECLAVFLLAVCGLVQCIGAVCDVSCTTDYFTMLNCSLSAVAGPVECDVEASCSDSENETVAGSCVIRPPSRWCTIKPEDFFLMAEHDTICTLTAKPTSQTPDLQNITSITKKLDSIIKPLQPFNLTLTQRNGSEDLVLSWVMPYKSEGYGLEDEMMYAVCLRLKDDQSKESCNLPYKIGDDHKYLEIECKLLSPGQLYVASVQATVNSPSFPPSQWSEWSSSIELTCPNTDVPDVTGPNGYLMLLCMLVALPFVLLIYFGKQGRLKKLAQFQYIPNPQDFFKPLYHTYQGDFKKWVGPVLTFNSFDILEKSVPLQVLSEKQLAALPLQREHLQEAGSGGGSGGSSGGSSSVGDWSLLSLLNPGSSKRYFFGDSSLGTTRSSGHISMDTVTVSGQEGTMSDWTGGSGGAGGSGGSGGSGSDRNRPDPGTLRAPGVSDEEDVLEFDGNDGLEERLFVNDMDNIEVISLDSYSSNEQSDDGYPQVGLDLDTIDSGFLESDCSSPVNSECDGSEQMEAALLGGGIASHSNYVKQWVSLRPSSEEDLSNSGQ
ncbi:interleukin-21 receptor [Astyanax mexicanus]|uniref:Interleukin-21 receptor n=1 Tax=Astyanax mexicanus TaxID=7994 RepID=A0A8B9GU22_ASTMX|nr:interleukin-21 receptor [Astyanax mexicanus]